MKMLGFYRFDIQTQILYDTCHMNGCTVFVVHSISATMLSNMRAASA